jgi:TPR repeat protein
MDFTPKQARSIVEIVDKLSLLSGIYPKILLMQSNEFNAFATYDQGVPFIVIKRPMFDLIANDSSLAAALLGHEMAHLYFRHGDGRAASQENAAIIGAVIGTLLEIFFIGRAGVIGLGSNIGNYVSSGIKGAYTRPQEAEADKQGMIWAIQAGYDPKGAIRLFGEMEKRGGNSLTPFLESHPNPSSRMENAQEIAELYSKYKNLEILDSPELQALNKKIDEDRERQQPKSESGKAGVTAFYSKDYLQAKVNFENCSEIACINNLGVLYQFGLGVQVDKTRAATYYKQASDMGSGLALFNYIGLYITGVDGAPDLFKTLSIEREAAERGSSSAMGTLAITALMSQLFGFPKEWQAMVNAKLPSDKTLVNYAKAAAMRGSKDGQTALGTYYLYGYGVKKNIDLAETYLNLASNSQDLRADASLIVLYENEKINKEKVEKIKQKYANNPNGSAGLSILMASYYCRSDISVEKQKKCFELVKAGRTFSSGPVVYGYVLSEGIGVSANVIEGNAWLLYARDKTGHAFASWAYARNIKNMNAVDIEKIQARAKQIAAGVNLSE